MFPHMSTSGRVKESQLIHQAGYGARISLVQAARGLRDDRCVHSLGELPHFRTACQAACTLVRNESYTMWMIGIEKINSTPARLDACEHTNICLAAITGRNAGDA